MTSSSESISLSHTFFIVGEFVGGLNEMRNLVATGQLQGHLDKAKKLMNGAHPDKQDIKVV